MLVPVWLWCLLVFSWTIIAVSILVLSLIGGDNSVVYLNVYDNISVLSLNDSDKN